MRSVHLLLASVFLGSLVILSGCGGGGNSSGGGGVVPPPDIPAHSKWAVLVYMVADSTLASSGNPYDIADLNEMERAMPTTTAGSDAPLSVVVQWDRPGVGNTKRLYMVHDETPTVVSPRIDNPQLGEVNMGKPESLKAFIDWGTATLKADHYLVVLWDHGNGWSPKYDYVSGGDASALAIGVYDKNGDVTSSSATAIRDVDLTWALGDTKHSILAFDACSMDMAEVAYQVRNNAEYMVSSEDITPGPGFNYNTIFQAIVNSSGDITPRDLATTMVDKIFTAWYQIYPITAIDLSKMDGVAASVNQFANHLIGVHDTAFTALKDARLSCTQFGYSGSSQPTYLCDLWDYADQVASEETTPRVPSALPYATAVRTAIQQAIVDHKTPTSQSYAHGLSIYLPTAAKFGELGTENSYRALAICGGPAITTWADWLKIIP